MIYYAIATEEMDGHLLLTDDEGNYLNRPSLEEARQLQQADPDLREGTVILKVEVVA